MLSPVRTKFSSFRRWAVLRVVARERDVLPCRLVVAVAGRSGSRHAGERSRILDLGLRRSLFIEQTPEGPLINFDDPTTGRVQLAAKLPNDSHPTPYRRSERLFRRRMAPVLADRRAQERHHAR